LPRSDRRESLSKTRPAVYLPGAPPGADRGRLYLMNTGGEHDPAVLAERLPDELVEHAATLLA